MHKLHGIDCEDLNQAFVYYNLASDPDVSRMIMENGQKLEKLKDSKGNMEAK